MRPSVTIPPGPRVATTAGTARALRREIAAHNRQVLLIAAFTLLVATLLWTVLYAVCRWLVVLILLIATDGAREHTPHGFGLVFGAAALCSIIYAWIDARLHPNAFPRDKRIPEIAADFVLALPRITLAVWGTLRAWLWLDRAERRMAAEFLHRLQRERRVAMYSVPLDIPGEPQRFRILFALQIIRAIELRRDGHETLIALDSQRPRSLLAEQPRRQAI